MILYLIYIHQMYIHTINIHIRYINTSDIIHKIFIYMLSDILHIRYSYIICIYIYAKATHDPVPNRSKEIGSKPVLGELPPPLLRVGALLNHPPDPLLPLRIWWMPHDDLKKGDNPVRLSIKSRHIWRDCRSNYAVSPTKTLTPWPDNGAVSLRPNPKQTSTPWLISSSPQPADIRAISESTLPASCRTWWAKNAVRRVLHDKMVDCAAPSPPG